MGMEGAGGKQFRWAISFHCRKPACPPSPSLPSPHSSESPLAGAAPPAPSCAHTGLPPHHLRLSQAKWLPSKGEREGGAKPAAQLSRSRGDALGLPILSPSLSALF